MIRKGVVALMITVMSAGSTFADDGQNSNPLMNFLRGPAIGRPSQKVRNTVPTRPGASGVTHAVVADAEKQVPEIRQTSSRPEPPQLQPATSAPQPTPTNVTPQAVVQQQPGMMVMTPVVPTAAVAKPKPHAPIGFNKKLPTAQSIALMGPITAPTANGAPLYPAPQPGIPPYVGVTLIPNPALHPHELTYPHQYRALYGPYYYKVNGHWVVTPFGVWSKENWKLQGTQVDVKYKSHISPFALFKPPVIR
ncbi:MAG: hypothetical protein Fues2KO_09370 [Fuerstiella sp.]